MRKWKIPGFKKRNVKSTGIVSIVIGTLASVTKEFQKWCKNLDTLCNATGMQKTVLLKTARVLKKSFGNVKLESPLVGPWLFL